MREYPKLAQPGRIGKMELKNRLALAAMAMFYVSEDGSVSDRQMDYYVARARGGTGLIITEAAYPRKKPYPVRLEINDDKYIPGIARLADAIHKAGAKIVLQMNPGRGRNDAVECLSASDVPSPAGIASPRAMTVEEIETLVHDFGEGVRRAAETGVDGIQIHANGGYLVDEFLSPNSNRRNDAYGGTVEKRTKFAIDLLKVSKARAGADFPVILKLMAEEHMEEGLPISQAIIIAQLLEKAGLDGLEVVSGNFAWTDDWCIAPMGIPRGYNNAFAAAIKANVKMPVMVGGRIVDPQQAEAILAAGYADFIALGRPLMADPEWTSKAFSGHARDIRLCISCLHCMDDLFKRKQGATCTVNPALGEEGTFVVKPAAKKKKVLVIGGGPAGMEAARISAERGHEVTLWEKADRLGGTLNVAVIPPHKEEIATVAEYLTGQLSKLGVRVEPEKEADEKSILDFGADVVFVATGADPARLNVPGADQKKVVTAIDVLTGKAQVGRNVVVVGGGLIGVETAHYLVRKGHNITVVSRQDKVASELGRTNRKMIIDWLIRSSNVRLVANFKTEEITETAVVGTSDGARIAIPADTVVTSAGMKANDELASSLKGKVPELYVIGDSAKPALIWDAIYAGAHTAIKI